MTVDDNLGAWYTTYAIDRKAVSLSSVFFDK